RPRRRGDRMRRREFVVVLGSTVVAPRFSRAQSGKLPVLGFLSGASRHGYDGYVAAFQSGLQELGYIDGQNLVIEFRWAEGRYDRLPPLLADLKRLGPAIIVATTGPGSTLAARSVTENVPVVFVSGTD